MPVFGTQNFGSAAKSAYSIDKSCMFDFASSSYLTRTPGSAGNRRTWTMSVWLKVTRKPSSTSGGLVFYQAGSTEFRWSDNNDQMYLIDGSSYKISTGKLRDTTGWFHLCIIADTPQGTASDRFKVYINGAVPTLTTDSAPSQDFDFDVNDTQAQNIGKEGSNYWDGYMADFHLIDGTAKAVGDFGETNDEGVWVPKQYTGGGYGTCGFHLDFADSADLGDDNSGQGNDWSEQNIAAAHQSSDSPTNNHCTWNYNYDMESTITLSEGCQNFLNSAGSQDKAMGTMFPRHGKWYWEVKWVSGSSGGQVGLSQNDVGSNEELGNNNSSGTGVSLGYRSHDGNTYKNSTLTSFGNSWSAGDVIGVAWDVGNGKIYFAKNNSWQNSGDPTSGATGTGSAYNLGTAPISGGGYAPAVCNEGSSLYEARFDEAKWDYSAPTGYKALCTANMDEPAVTDPSTKFDMLQYTGNGSSTKRTDISWDNMQPDWVIVKNRSQGDSWMVHDVPRTVTNYLYWDARADEAGPGGFGTDGFGSGGTANQLRVFTSDDKYNASDEIYLVHGWYCGGSGSSNENGSINTTTTYVDTTSKVSISTYTGNGTDDATVGHGLGVTPDTVMIIQRSNNDHHPLVTWEVGQTQYSEKAYMDHIGDAFTSSGNMIKGGSSTTFTLGTDPGVNRSSGTFVAYSMAEVEGFSKFGTYTGNADAEGPYCYCGFAPEVIWIKCDKSNEPWNMFSRTVNNYNPAVNFMWLNDSSATLTTNDTTVDFLSNGFKITGNDTRVNDSGTSIIFLAFARHPMGGENVAPSKTYF
jgi:hypothetical protein